MIHCFVDRDAQALPSWLEAFPQARVVRRQDQATIADGAGILWCRCGPRESLATILGALTISPTQIVVVLADEHGDAIIAEACSLGASGCCNTHAAPELLRQQGNRRPAFDYRKNGQGAYVGNFRETRFARPPATLVAHQRR